MSSGFFVQFRSVNFTIKLARSIIYVSEEHKTKIEDEEIAVNTVI